MSVRLIRAEALKLRKSRGLVIATVLMTLGIGALVILIPEFYRLAHPTAAFAGGARGLQRIGIAVGFIGSIAAMLVGTAAGTGDLSTGIFRDMVATGKSRAALFGARVPGALIYWLPLVTFAYLVSALLDLAFSDHHPPAPVRSASLPVAVARLFNQGVPAIHQYVDWYLWILLYTVFVLLVSIGLSSLLGSRAITLGILIPFQLFVAPVLSGITQLGAVREAFYPQSIALIEPLGPGGRGQHSFGVLVTSSLTVAWLVLAAWVVVALAVGLWKTSTRDV